MANENLSKLEAELYAIQQDLKAAENDEKYPQLDDDLMPV